MIFRSEGTLLIHKESHKKPEFKCDECSKDFFTETDLANHKFEHEDKRRRELMAKEAEERENKFECKKEHLQH